MLRRFERFIWATVAWIPITSATGYFLYPYLVEEEGSDLAGFVMVSVASGILVSVPRVGWPFGRTRRAPSAFEALAAKEGLLYRALSERAIEKQQSRRRQDEEARKRAVEQVAHRRQKDAEERRRWEQAWRQPERREARGNNRDESMSVARALEVLGLKAGVTEREIRAAYINLIKRVHADQGGSDYLAKQVNAARDALRGHGRT